MKELTYEDWQKNPTSRMMWVWDDVTFVVKRKVAYVLKGNSGPYKVITINNDNSSYNLYKQCAEIEEPKIRRMTNQELTWWLRKKPTREWKCNDSNSVCGVYDYEESKASEEVDSRILIREDNGEWREPLVEVEE